MADTYQFLVGNYGDAYRRVPNVGVLGKGDGENNMYFLTVNPANGALLVDAQVVFDQDTNYGPVGDDTLRTAAQIGNATGAADFNAGATSAQTLRVVLADEQADAITNIETYTSIIATETGEIAEDVMIMGLDVADIKTAVEATQTAVESIDTKTPTLGQKTKAGSVPVVIASDQDPLAVTVTIAPADAVIARVSAALSGVTTSAYTEIIPATAADIKTLTVFESSGEGLILALGASTSEVDLLLIPPGGFDGVIPLAIPSGSRISIKSLLANSTDGALIANFFG